jgi:glycosyltransferase involved in cell wall biosynthesis
MSNVFISVCIPAYKRVEYLKRLLDSISAQRFRNFEVIVTDDSPSGDVRMLCREYENSFPITYYKNEVTKGTPENWNEAVRHATGEWIKLMHDDDWFASPDSLGEFAKATETASAQSFFYSAYQNVYEVSGKKEIVRINEFRKRKLEQDPVTLFSSNVIGPPSVTLVKKEQMPRYDDKMIWLVDIDFYIRALTRTGAIYIDQPLVNVGINNEQVTRKAFRVPAVEIPENFSLLEKTGPRHLGNLLVYDAWWRSIRNLKIGSIDTIRANGYKGNIPPVIGSMINWQSKLPALLLKTGSFSKLFMFIHYLSHRTSLKK